MTSYVKKSPRRYIARTIVRGFEQGSPPYNYEVDRVQVDNNEQAVSGQDNSQYRAVIRSGGNATNPGSGYVIETTRGGGSASCSFRWRRWEGDPPTYVLYKGEDQSASSLIAFVPEADQTSVPQSIIDAAKARFVQKVNRQLSPFQSGVFLGELRDTIRTVSNPAQALRRRLSAYLGDVKKRTRGLQKAGNRKKNAVVSATWLEYTFGWKPLLSDIDSGMEALSRVTSGTYPDIRISAVETYEPDPDLVGGQSESYCGETILYKHRYRTKCSVRVYGGVNSKTLQASGFRGAFGLRPHDFLPTVWELIPYSFVVDYFTNIGDIINAVSFCNSRLEYSGLTTRYETTVETCDFHHVNQNMSTPTFSRQGHISLGVSRSKRIGWARSQVGSLLPSEVTFHLPGVRQQFNLLALLSQARGTKI